MLPYGVDEVFAILRAARTDPRLGEVLAAFRRQWLRIARREYAAFIDDFDDVVQLAQERLASPALLESIQSPERIEAVARSVFVHAMIDTARARRRDWSRRLEATADHEPDEFLRHFVASADPTPDEQAAETERVAVIVCFIERFPVARLRWLDGLSEKEIEELTGRSRNAIASQLKRVRAQLRVLLDTPDADRDTSARPRSPDLRRTTT